MDIQVVQREITEYFYSYSANDLRAICKKYKLECDDSLEPMNSKRIYIKSGLLKMNVHQLYDLIAAIVKENECPKFVRAIDGYIEQDPFEITMHTRRMVIDVLSKGHCIEGKIFISNFLNRIWDLKKMHSYYDNENLETDIIRYMQANDDLSYEEMFDILDILYISDDRFKKFLTQVVHPAVRINSNEQAQYVHEINDIIIRDGYTLFENGQLAGNPLYSVMKIRNSTCGTVKNLLFASICRKPDIVIEDSLSNELTVVNNEDSDCLIYNYPINPKKGLTWDDLVIWWNKDESNYTVDIERQLYTRLKKSLDSEPEKLFFDLYYRITHPQGTNMPALIPQVYCHYDPKTAKFRNGNGYVHQRMDFLMILPNETRIVVEIDGKQHYSKDGRASSKLYAEMVSDDRKLKLYGYEVYRFGGYEFINQEKAEEIVNEFIKQLFLKYPVYKEIN